MLDSPAELPYNKNMMKTNTTKTWRGTEYTWRKSTDGQVQTTTAYGRLLTLERHTDGWWQIWVDFTRLAVQRATLTGARDLALQWASGGRTY